MIAVVETVLFSTTTTAKDIWIDNEVDLNIASSSMFTLLIFLLFLRAFLFAPTGQLLDWQDHHTFRTHRLREPRIFGPTEAAEGEDEEEVGDKEECKDGQYIKNVDGYLSLRGRLFLRFNYLRSKVSQRAGPLI